MTGRSRVRLGWAPVSKRHGSRRSNTANSGNNGQFGNGRRPATGTTDRESKARDTFVGRPFAGLVDEPEWVALRELVPAATAPLRLLPELAGRYGDPTVLVATVLPMAAPALMRADGTILVGLQRQVRSGDVSRDLGVALQAALETEPGGTVSVPPLATEGPRLQELLSDAALEVTLHDSFRFWLDAEAADDPTVAASLERADAAIHPTVRMASVAAAYWVRMPERVHLRWVLPDEENSALDALARLAAAEEISLGEGTRFAGTFRAHGLLVPVWDLPAGRPAGDWEEPLTVFAERYAAARGSDEGLSGAARRARAGLLGRQFTLR